MHKCLTSTFVLILAVFSSILPRDLKALQRTQFMEWGQKEGLASTLISRITQDSAGFIWIGHDEGVSTFDGNRFLNLRPPPGKIWGGVNNIVFSRFFSGRTWIATNRGGLYFAERNELTKVKTGETLEENAINDLVELGRDSLLLATDAGLFLQTPSKRIEFPLEKGDTLAVRLFFDGNFHFLLTDFRVYRIHPESIALETIWNPGQKRSERFYTFYAAGKGRALLQLRDESFWMLENGKMNPLELPKGFSPRIWQSLPDGSLRIVTEKGYFKASITNGALNAEPLLSLESGVHFPMVTAGFLDRDENLWVAIRGRVLMKLYALEAQFYPISQVTGTVAMDTSGRLFIPNGTQLLTLKKEKDGRFSTRQVRLRGANPSRVPFGLVFDPRGALWISFAPEFSMERFKLTDPLPDELFPDVHIGARTGFRTVWGIKLVLDAKNRLWMPVGDSGLVVVDVNETPKEVQQFDPRNGFPIAVIRMLTSDRNGTIWAGGQASGLVRFNTQEFPIQFEKLQPDPDWFDSHGVRSFLQAKDGSIWIGGRYSGLARWDKAVFRRLAESDGLMSRQIWSLTESPDGTIYAGTQNGVFQIKRNGSRWLAVKLPSIHGQVPEVGFFPDGTFWALTYEGVHLLPQRPEIPVSTPAPVTILSVQAGSRNVTGETFFNLEHEERTAKITFTAVNHRVDKEIKFQYRLLPADTTWSFPSDQRSVEITGPGAGRYLMEIRSVFVSDALFSDPVVLTFRVFPPWWKHPLFVIPLVLVLLALTGLIVWLWVQKMLAVERIRAGLARDLHDDIGSGLTRLSMLAEVLQRMPVSEKEVAPGIGSPKEVAQSMGNLSRELIDEMADVIFAIDPRKESTSQLLHRLKVFGNQLFSASGIEFVVEGAELTEETPLTAAQRRAVLLAVKETLTNAVRHAQANHVHVLIHANRSEISLKIEDNGKGFDPSAPGRINGLHNIKERVEKAGGVFRLDSSPGKGTRTEIRFSV